MMWIGLDRVSYRTPHPLGIYDIGGRTALECQLPFPPGGQVGKGNYDDKGCRHAKPLMLLTLSLGIGEGSGVGSAFCWGSILERATSSVKVEDPLQTKNQTTTSASSLRFSPANSTSCQS